MVQESTMICVDNSEWMRNGDYIPTRLQAQQDAANLIVQCKLRANPENAVGILSMANEVRVLSTMTQENSKLFMKLHSIEPKGKCDVLTGIKVAHLALKHRQNRNHKMRIVLFVGSPMEAVDDAELTKMAKKLKKEKVQIDIICFGTSDSENAEQLNSIIETLNGRDGSGSNMVVVGPGGKIMEALMSSPILRGEDGAAAPQMGVGGGFDLGEEDDPDLALALRVSLEEQRARQSAQTNEERGAAENNSNVDVVDIDMESMTEEQQLEWALRMSIQESLPAETAPAPMETENAPAPMDEDEPTTPTQPQEAAGEDLDELLNDPDLLQQIVDELPEEGEKKEEGSEKK